MSNERKVVQIDLPADLIAALDAASAERIIGRRLLIELLLTQAIAALKPPAAMELLTAPPAVPPV